MRAALRESRGFRFVKRHARWLTWQSSASVASTLSAWLVAVSVNGWFSSELAAALGGTVAENTGYYLVILLGVLRGSGGRLGLLRAAKTVMSSYAPLEVLDAIVRPSLFYVSLTAFPGIDLALIAAGYLADAVFYGMSFCLSRRLVL